MIAIFTLAEDLHALEVRKSLQRLGHNAVHIIESDRISASSCLSCSLGWGADPPFDAYVTSSSGLRIRVSDIAVIWLRRPRGIQTSTITENSKELEFINNECRGGMTSLLSACSFRGRWVSEPEATTRASDKLHQLNVASKCGFRIPKTLMTQSKEEVISFYEMCGRKVVVKPLIGVSSPFLLTRKLENPESIPELAYSACPAIYQELIEGTDHIRLNCFGRTQIAALIRSNELDWRPNLNVPISALEVPEDIRGRTQKVLNALGLEMGIIDLKIDLGGNIVWFEVNPQGQFLFLEPFINAALSDHFARFLIDCKNSVPPEVFTCSIQDG